MHNWQTEKKGRSKWQRKRRPDMEQLLQHEMQDWKRVKEEKKRRK